MEAAAVLVVLNGSLVDALVVPVLNGSEVVFVFPPKPVPPKPNPALVFAVEEADGVLAKFSASVANPNGLELLFAEPLLLFPDRVLPLRRLVRRAERRPLRGARVLALEWEVVGVDDTSNGLPKTMAENLNLPFPLLLL